MAARDDACIITFYAVYVVLAALLDAQRRRYMYLNRPASSGLENVEHDLYSPDLKFDDDSAQNSQDGGTPRRRPDTLSPFHISASKSRGAKQEV